MATAASSAGVCRMSIRSGDTSPAATSGLVIANGELEMILVLGAVDVGVDTGIETEVDTGGGVEAGGVEGSEDTGVEHADKEWLTQRN